MYTRDPKGQRAVGDHSAKRGQNVSLVNALSLRGPIAPLTILGAMDGLTFSNVEIPRSLAESEIPTKGRNDII